MIARCFPLGQLWIQMIVLCFTSLNYDEEPVMLICQVVIRKRTLLDTSQADSVIHLSQMTRATCITTGILACNLATL